MRQARDHAPRANEREDAVRQRDHERHDPEREVEEQADEAADHDEEHDEAEDDHEAAEPVRADLLLECHAPAANETWGTAVSPSAEKNSRARKPKGFASRSHGMLCTAVLKCITVAL